MARKEKIDNAFLKRFAREEKKRKEDIREQKVYFLIFCEGEKTEPYYFEALKKQLPAHSLDIQIQGTARNTINLVEFAAKQIKQSNKHYDRVWLVFDRDSFPGDNFDNAIHKANSQNMQCAWSNEAFELWYLLHFQFISTPMSRDDYKSYLENEIHKKGDNSFTYVKNATDLFEIINKHGSEAFAIKNAEKLKDRFDDNKFSTHNPCTLVHELIHELRNPIEVLRTINNSNSNPDTSNS